MTDPPRSFVYRVLARFGRRGHVFAYTGSPYRVPPGTACICGRQVVDAWARGKGATP